jgi:hypothetical protein
MCGTFDAKSHLLLNNEKEVVYRIDLVKIGNCNNLFNL